MAAKEYINSLPEPQKNIVQQFRKIILDMDKGVEETFGKIMNIESALRYNQSGVFKYGFAVTKNYFTFHSMVMYANPILANDLKGKLKGVKFQKGCINFKNVEDFPLAEFKKHIEASAKIDFSPVIKHYNAKK